MNILSEEILLRYLIQARFDLLYAKLLLEYEHSARIWGYRPWDQNPTGLIDYLYDMKHLIKMYHSANLNT